SDSDRQMDRLVVLDEVGSGSDWEIERYKSPPRYGPEVAPITHWMTAEADRHKAIEQRKRAEIGKYPGGESLRRRKHNILPEDSDDDDDMGFEEVSKDETEPSSN